MKIFATGHPARIFELKQKLGPGHFMDTVAATEMDHISQSTLAGYDLLFDLDLDEDASRLMYYAPLRDKVVVVCSVKQTLHQMFSGCNDEIQCILIGMNALPTFINRSLAELTLFNAQDEAVLDSVFKSLQWDYRLVKDQAGMVTPRILTMLINEACFVLAEGTATITDIDMAMKLGTNYPYGPFEWCDKIGIRNVYETLNAIAVQSGDGRYRICDLLKERYRLAQPFYKI